MEEKDKAIVVLCLLCVALLVSNVFMAVNVRRNIDKCNQHCKQQLIDHNCIVASATEYGLGAGAYIEYDIPMVNNKYNVSGDYEWK